MIPVMFCFNNNYALPAAGAIYSLLENSSKNEKYELHIVHSDITQENQDKLQETIKEFEFASLNFINIHGRFDETFKKLPQKNFSPDLFSKLIASNLFPQYDKIVISDVDVVFLRDLAPLYHNYTDDTYMCVPGDFRKIKKPIDYPSDIIAYFSVEEQEVLLNHEFAAGLMIHNLKSMRKDNIEEKLLTLLEKHAPHLYLPEQEILTLACYKNISRLPSNAMIFFHTTEKNPLHDSKLLELYGHETLQYALENMIQWHYVGYMKPWKYPKAYNAHEFYRYIVKTPFMEEYFRNFLPAEDDSNTFIGKIKKIRKKLSRSIRKRLSKLSLMLYA